MKSEVLLVLLLFVSLGCNLFSRLTGDSPAAELEPVVLPAVPKLIEPMKGTPEEQAIFFVDQLSSPDTRLAGWLGLYDALGIPVLGENDKPVGSTGDDPIGPRYWQIWYSSALDNASGGIPIADAGRILGAGMSEFNDETLGPIILNDLKAALESDDRQVRLLAHFVRERIMRGSSHVDIQKPDATAESAIVDSGSLQLIAWVALRGAIMRFGREAVKKGAPRAGVNAIGVVSLLQTNNGATSTPCSKVVGGSYQWTYWLNWVVKKVIARGVQLPGMEKAFPGLVERLLKSIDDNDNWGDDRNAKARNGLAWANAIGNAFSLLHRILAMQVTARQDPEPLERTKGTSNGKEGRVTFALSIKPHKPAGGTETTSDGNRPDNCLLTYLASVVGTTFSLPPSGPIAGAGLEFKGGKGFPDLVLFADYNDLSGRDTNDNGEVTIELIGAGQKRHLPQNSKSVNKQFSIHVSAQPEAYNANTIINTFFNGLNFGTRANLPGAMSALVDVLKTVHYDMGEHTFQLKDWQLPGYRAEGSFGPNKFFGTICSLEEQFTVQTSNPFMPEFTFKPASANDGWWSYPYVGVSGSGAGRYILEGPPEERTGIMVTGSGTVVAPVSGTGSGSVRIQLVPLNPGEGCGS